MVENILGMRLFKHTKGDHWRAYLTFVYLAHTKPHARHFPLVLCIMQYHATLPMQEFLLLTAFVTQIHGITII